MRVRTSSWGLLACATFSWAIGCGDDDACEDCGAGGLHRGGANNAGGARNYGGRAGLGGTTALAGAGAAGFVETGGVTARGGSTSVAGAPSGGASGTAGDLGVSGDSWGGVDSGSGGTGPSRGGSPGLCEAGNGGEGGSFWTWDSAACNDFHCGDHGTCVTTLNEQHCQCKPGFQGTLCDEDIDECAQNPCSGECVNTIGGFTCQCPAGRTGTQCELPVFQGIGVLSGDTDSRAVAISRDGRQVLATSYAGGSSSRGHVVLFDVAGGTLKKVSPEDRSSCEAVAVNGDGTVVVGNCGQNYIWRSGAIEYLDGELAYADITGMSSDGSVLVGTHDVNHGLFAFRADASGLEDLLATRAGGPTSATVSVSSDGNIVAAASATSAAYVWSKQFGLSRLVGNFQCAPQVSVVVSGDGSTFFSGGDRRLFVDIAWISVGPAFRWRGDLIEPSEVGVIAVSNDGGVMLSEVLGMSADRRQATGYYIHRVDGTDLTPALTKLVPSDWQIWKIAAISGDGKAFAGYGVHAGHFEGWVAHLP